MKIFANFDQVQLVKEKTGLHHAMHGEQPSARDTLQDIMITKRKIQEAKARQRPKSSPAIKSSGSTGSPAASGRDRGGAGKEEGDFGGPTRMSVESPKMRSMKRPSGSGMASGQRSSKHSPASSKGYRLASAGGVSQHSAASTRLDRTIYFDASMRAVHSVCLCMLHVCMFGTYISILHINICMKYM
jgi:hypothetical protein